MPDFWNQKSFVLITGSSRGLGRAIAIEFSKHVAPGSVFLLVARTAEALEETKAKILEVAPAVEVITRPLDLAKPDREVYHELLISATTTNGRSASQFDHAILVHNAASLGDLSLKVSQIEDVSELSTYYSTNVFSMVVLNTQFFKVFKDVSKQRSIIHITSKGALQPFKTWGYYCAGKAARNMLMRSVSIEDPSISVLNYAPGHFESAIYEEAAQKTGDDETRQTFITDKEQGRIITAEQSAQKLVRILRGKGYTKGEYVEYYEIPDE